MLYCSNLNASLPKVMPQISPRKRWALPAWVDSLGSAGAVFCALHCALLPLLLAVLPTLGLAVLASSRL